MSARKIFKYVITTFFVTAAANVSAHAVILSYGDIYNLPIPQESGGSKGWAEDAILNIADDYVIWDLDVEINITHTNVFDLQVFLISPAGTNVCLSRFYLDEFFIGANYDHTIFDDEAPVPIELGLAPFTGRYRPRYGLDAFDGESILGAWRLRVYDGYEFDAGILESFELQVTIPEPATLLLLTAGFIFVKRFRFSAG